MRTILDPTVYKTVTAPCPGACTNGYNTKTKQTCGVCGGKGTITVNVPD